VKSYFSSSPNLNNNLWPEFLLQLFTMLAALLVTVTAMSEELPAVLPGDELLVDIASHPELSGVHMVDVRGYLVLPPVSPCSVGGLTVEEAAQHLSTEMAHFYRGVSGLEIRILRRQLAVRVEGRVNQPGDYLLPYYANLEDALRAAGGIDQGGLLTRVLVQRDKEYLEVDLRKYRIGGDRGLLPLLKTGDRVFVPVSNRDAPIMAPLAPLDIPFEDPNVVHVIGAVPKGGTHQMPGSLSLFEALALGGGPGKGANLKTITIMPPDDDPYKVNLLDFTEGQKSTLPRITAGTTILVEEKNESFFKKTLTIVAPLVLSTLIVRELQP